MITYKDKVYKSYPELIAELFDKCEELQGEIDALDERVKKLEDKE